MTNFRKLPAVTMTATILGVLVLSFSVRSWAGEKNEDPMPEGISPKQWKEITKVNATTWQIEIHLDMPTLNPQAVQFAILDKDPALDYKAHLKRVTTLNRQQLESADSEPWKKMLRYVQMKVDWDNGFNKVTGADLVLLTTPPGVVISSNGPAGKKWVVTKCRDIDGRPVCWSIPIEVKIGKRENVTLNKDNTFDLQTPYDAAMNEPESARPATKSSP